MFVMLTKLPKPAVVIPALIVLKSLAFVTSLIVGVYFETSKPLM